METKKILLAYYGDDFTGSTDALEFIYRAGGKAILFTEPPTQQQLQQIPDLNAYGIAGKSRALDNQAIEKEMKVVFAKMKNINAKHIHYKVCSTFDSSDKIGNIGRVIDIATQVFQLKCIPILGGTPALGRYCLFGNLFAKMGIGSEGQIYRLDRHPSMTKHPITPADESDLRLHLQKQTQKKIALIDILNIEKDINEWLNITKHNEAVLIDTLYEKQLTKIGQWIDTKLFNGNPTFSIGSSALAMALGNYWQSTNILKTKPQIKPIEKVNPLLIVSGSCSPITQKQIQWASTNGFEQIIIDINELPDTVLQTIILSLQANKNLIVHTGTRKNQIISSEKLGNLLGNIIKKVRQHIKIKRVVITGGDTSSYTARAMDIEAMEIIAPVVSGSPLCKAFSKNQIIDGLEVNFKGGQVGADNYFGLLLNGN